MIPLLNYQIILDLIVIFFAVAFPISLLFSISVKIANILKSFISGDKEVHL